MVFTRRTLPWLTVLLLLLPWGLAQANSPTNTEIRNYRAPLVRLLANETQLTRRDYRRVIGPVEIRDAPAGNVIEFRPEGEFYVSLRSTQGDWAEINEGEWIPLGQLERAVIGSSAGVEIEDEPAYPFGWLLDQLTPSRNPGAEPLRDDEPLARYTLVNVFLEDTVAAETWYQIGVDQWVRGSQIAIQESIARPDTVDTERWVGVDLSAQVITAYEGTTPRFAALVASGLSESPTSPGTFHVFFRTHVRDMTRGDIHEPFYYYMEDVPYTLYFDGNHALHGAYWHDDFGRVRSHGCVNMSLTDAFWVYDFLSAEINFNDPADIWPVVYVYE
jgi:hypothetical protein